jgi:hypothetical protein
MTARAILAVAALALGSACGKGSAGDAPLPSAAPSAPAASAPPSASAAAPAPSAPTVWKGAYKSVAGEMTLPKGVAWKVAESTAGLGEGTLALTVDPATGRVTGTLDGALGPATVDGFVADGKLTATIARRDPSDQGFTGTLSATAAPSGMHGSMNLSLAEVSAVRTATFDLAPASEPAR